MQEYADPVIDWLDAGRGILTRRFFREVGTRLITVNFPCLIIMLPSLVPNYRMGRTLRTLVS